MFHCWLIRLFAVVADPCDAVKAPCALFPVGVPSAVARKLARPETLPCCTLEVLVCPVWLIAELLDPLCVRLPSWFPEVVPELPPVWFAHWLNLLLRYWPPA